MQSESPHLYLCPWDLLPTLLIARVIFKDAPREQCVFETTWIGYMTDHHYDLNYKCLRFWQMGTLLWPPKTSSCMYISLLIKLTAYQSRRRQWHPTPVLLPRKSHGRRSLVGCSPWGREESDTTERLHFPFSLSCIGEGNGNPLQCSCL